MDLIVNWRNSCVILSEQDHSLHSSNCLKGILTVGRFVRKHDRVSALNHSVCHIAYFSTSWLWVVHHACHHLCCDDTELAVLAAERNNTALDNRHDFRPGFNREVTTSNHNTVARFHNFFKYVCLNSSFRLNL
ncbi:hypothetical protein D3C87_1656530 [compost metagenome]